MNVKHARQSLVVLLAASMMAGTAMAENLAGTVTYGDVAEPDAELAAYKFDATAARALAKAHDTSGGSLIFYPFEIKLRKEAKKGAEVSAIVPPATLMAWEFEKDLPKDWDHYYAMNGADGYMKRRDDQLYLSQMHVCFAKVKGAYKISGIFGYGL